MKTVKCSFCGKEMDCPKSIPSDITHICHYCGDLLERGYNEKDVGKASRKMQEGGFFDVLDHSGEIAEKIAELKFKKIWKGDKKSLMSLSKQDLSGEMFFQGVLYTLVALDMAGIMNKESRKDLESFAKAMEKNDQDKMSEIAQKYLRLELKENVGEKINKGTEQPS